MSTFILAFESEPFISSVRRVRGRKRPSTGRKPGILSGSSWRKTSNIGVPVFTPSPVEETPGEAGTTSDPLMAFDALSSRSKRKLVVDSTHTKVLGESMVNAFRPTAFARAKQQTVVATVTSEYNVGILLALDYATYDRFVGTFRFFFHIVLCVSFNNDEEWIKQIKIMA